MKTHLWMAVVLTAVFALPALAHEGEESTPGVVESATAQGEVSVEASVVVEGTVAALKGALLNVRDWPRLFSDARGLEVKAGEVWSVDFVRFGHPHDFRVARNPRSVVLELATEGHGAGRLEYALSPWDAQHSVLTVRFKMGTPKGMTSAQALRLLRDKATADLADFARASASPPPAPATRP